MVLNTKHFGQIHIKEENIIEFPEGLPGFEELKKYIILENPDKEIPFHWLQSIEDTDLAFVIINPFIFKPDYDFEIPKTTVEKLQIQQPQDIEVFSIVVIPEDIKKMRANLKAPLIINTKNKKGKQLLLDHQQYQTKHYILEELQNLPKTNSKEEVK